MGAAKREGQGGTDYGTEDPYPAPPHPPKKKKAWQAQAREPMAH